VTHPARAASRRGDLVVSRWRARFMGRSFPCAIGRGGIVRNKVEGDGGTPAGVLRLQGGFYRADRMPKPRALLPIKTIGPWDVWCDDPENIAYNQQRRSMHPAYSHENMRRSDPLYDFGLITDYNMDQPVPGKGSAIFVHIWRGTRKPTEGCVAFKRRHLEWIIKRWQANSRLVIQE
jgi:L,D-peptidoglycan transpeptidase YkuD (ErfK/YbiS/YcfS/YnhG family)